MKFIHTFFRQKKYRFTFRAILITLLLLGALAFSYSFTISPILEEKRVFLTSYFSLEDEIYLLKKETRPKKLDSLLQENNNGVFQKWIDVANWLEDLRPIAKKNNIDFSYQLDSLLYPPQAHNRIGELSVKLNLTNKSLSPLLSFLEQSLQDPTLNLNLQQVDILADSSGINETTIVYQSWLRK